MPTSIYLANAVLNAVFKGTALPVTFPVYASLHTADPGRTGAAEVVGGSYARQQVPAAQFDAAAAGAIPANAVKTFQLLPPMTITYAGFWDAASGGNFLWGGPLTAPKIVPSGGAVQFPVTDLAATLT